MKKIVFIIFDKDADRIYARAVSISEDVLEYYTRDEIVRIIGGDHSSLMLPIELYDGPIHEHLSFNIKIIGDYVANIIKKEDEENE